MFLYQISGYDLHEGERVNEILLTVSAENEGKALFKAAEIAPRTYYKPEAAAEEMLPQEGPNDEKDS